MKSNDALDEALAMLADSGPEFGGGLSNHGPMAAEALCAMGRGEQAVAWVERYRKRLEPAPQASGRIDDKDWRDALGRINRVAEWSDFFSEQLKQEPWREVVDTWTARLAPGISAAAFHGVLRTGHAARSLSEHESTERLHELGHDLAYWAATYHALRGVISTSRDALPSQAIRSVERLPLQRRKVGGFLTDGLASLDDFAPFAEVVAMVDASRDVGAFIADLTETFAHVYMKNAIGIGGIIAFIHCVTGPRAVRHLAPHVKPVTAAIAARYAWQAAAGLYAAFAAHDPSGEDSEAPEVELDDLIDRAVANADEHAIKFAEACIGEHALNPKAVYLEAVAHAVKNLPPLR
jgi:hypothetical protein